MRFAGPRNTTKNFSSFYVTCRFGLFVFLLLMFSQMHVILTKCGLLMGQSFYKRCCWTEMTHLSTLRLFSKNFMNAACPSLYCMRYVATWLKVSAPMAVATSANVNILQYCSFTPAPKKRIEKTKVFIEVLVIVLYQLPQVFFSNPWVITKTFTCSAYCRLLNWRWHAAHRSVFHTTFTYETAPNWVPQDKFLKTSIQNKVPKFENLSFNAPSEVHQVECRKQTAARIVPSIWSSPKQVPHFECPKFDAPRTCGSNLNKYKIH